MLPITLIAGLVSLAALLVLSAVRAARRYASRRAVVLRNGCVPSHHRVAQGDPVIGLSFLLETIDRARRDEYMALSLERFRRLGTTYVNDRLLFSTVSTVDPENVQAVLSSAFDAFRMPDIRVRALMPIFGDGIFVNDGPKWQHSRSMLRPIFYKRNMAPLIGRCERHFQLMLRNQLLPHFRHGGGGGEGNNTADTTSSELNLHFPFHALTMDIATEFLLGRSTNTLDPANCSDAEAAFVEDYRACTEEATRTVQMGPLYKLKRGLDSAAARDRSWAYVDRYVGEALERRDRYGSGEKAGGNGGDDYVFIDDLVRRIDDRDLLRTQVMNVLLASRDTTAALLDNLFFMLARHPDAWDRIRDEVGRVVGEGNLPTEENMKNMPWLKNCIDESLRLHPPVPASTRETSRDIALPVGGGADGRSPLFVRAGTVVMMNTYAMQRRGDIFGPEPDEFRPERWDSIKPGWAYIPFQAGPRTCLGQQFAMVEAAYIIIRMAQSFKQIIPRDNEPYQEHYAIVLYPRKGVPVRLVAA